MMIHRYDTALLSRCFALSVAIRQLATPLSHSQDPKAVKVESRAAREDTLRGTAPLQNAHAFPAIAVLPESTPINKTLTASGWLYPGERRAYGLCSNVATCRL